MNPILQQFDITGRIALITGSSTGIGFALARGLAQAGAVVVLNGRDTDKLSHAASLLEAEGIHAHAVPFDVTDAAAVEAGIAKIEADIGAIDILVNNAGMTRRNRLDEFKDEDWHNIMRTNIDSVFMVGRSVAKRMITRKCGKIINIASVQSELGRPGVAPYAASKGAVKMLTKGMAIDWAPLGLNVNAIGPGYFKTELTDALVKDEAFSTWLLNRTPAKRWGNVEDLVGAAVYLSSDASRFVNGITLYVDGGVTASL
jgi:gluconate 5-dehydrogenase